MHLYLTVFKLSWGRQVVTSYTGTVFHLGRETQGKGMGDAAKKSGDHSTSAAIGLCDQDNQYIELINFIPSFMSSKKVQSYVLSGYLI